MKLSEMSTQKAAQVMCDIAVPVANIAQDEKLAEAFRAIAKSDLNSMSRIAQYGLMGSKLLPLLLKDHLDDVCQVMRWRRSLLKMTARTHKRPISAPCSGPWPLSSTRASI